MPVCPITLRLAQACPRVLVSFRIENLEYTDVLPDGWLPTWFVAYIRALALRNEVELSVRETLGRMARGYVEWYLENGGSEQKYGGLAFAQAQGVVESDGDIGLFSEGKYRRTRQMQEEGEVNSGSDQRFVRDADVVVHWLRDPWDKLETKSGGVAVQASIMVSDSRGHDVL